MTDKSSLVLSGGGHYGIAFHLGFLKGVADAGLNLRQVDYIVGTSAGSQVSATLSSPLDWETIWQEQIVKKVNEITPISDAEMTNLFKTFDELAKTSLSDKSWVAGMGEISKNTHPFVSLEERRNMIRERLGSVPLEWNEQLQVVATELETSERKVFNKYSNVDLVDALAASSALQGVWQPIPINNHLYYDGGSYSMENPDVIDGVNKVVILTTNLPVATPYRLNDIITRMKREGKAVFLVKPDASVVSILEHYNYNTVNAEMREAVALAAVNQGKETADELKRFLEQS
ncbi:patatin-like phospholipase family protein [Staphylococcus lugdunensis]|uniref:patatin-like phospholipase family protein n=1 Tax=Staphylococcus lugdunensis TaxID=28035 RepID=UPI001F4C9A80|nr:patatin-like phospholipase family protein [Staphylococcus lugdunensis]MCH8647998.1 patatin-like phospholipase family protein [Staphylococcus lugdunensis]